MRPSPAALAGVIVALLLCAGLPRLTLDGAAPFRLPDDDPLVAANAKLVKETGGDDLVAAVISDSRGGPHGLLDADGVAALESVRAALGSNPALRGVRSVTTAPILGEREGAMSASTPFLPAPTDPDGWSAARSALLGDPFVPQLISDDRRVAVVVGWVDRRPADAALVGAVSAALRGGGLPPEVAIELRRVLSEARLAVALGDEEGPPDAVAARRLAEHPAVRERGWVAAAEDQAADPAGVAWADAVARLAAVDLPQGITAAVAGPRASEEALSLQAPIAVRFGLLAVLAAAGLAGGRVRRRPSEGLVAVVAGVLAFGGSLGASGWLGQGLHPWLPILALVTAAWTSSLVVAGRAEVGASALWVAAPAGLVLAAGGGPGVAGAAAVSLGLGLLLAWGLAPRRAPRSAPAPAVSVPVATALALLLLALAAGQPQGVDPSRLLAPRHPVGAATHALAEALGTAPGAFLVYDGGAARAITHPRALQHLVSLQRALRNDAAVRSTASWADLIAQLHRAVAGPDAERLPEHADAVEQYLLLFARPDETRALASLDLSLAVVLLRLAPGGGAHLARLSDEFGAGDDAVTLAGQSVEMARASRTRARMAFVALGLGLLLLGLGAALRRDASAFAGALACAAVAGAVTTLSLGSLSFASALAAGIVAGGSAATLRGGPGRVAAVPLLALGVLAGSTVTLYSALGLGVSAGLALSLLAPPGRDSA